MRTLALLLVSVLPSIILFHYFHKKDIIEREPRSLLVIAFILGVLSIIPAVILELLLGASPSNEQEQSIGFLFYEAFIAVAFVEEFVKFLVVRFWAMRRPAFNEMYDGILYAICISLGFATLENILYVLQGGFFVALIRAIFTVPMHVLGSVIIGYYVAKRKFNFDKEKYLTFKALFLPVVLHGLFDFVLMIVGRYPLVTLVGLLFTMTMYIVITVRIFKKVKASYRFFTHLARPETLQRLGIQIEEPVAISADAQDAVATGQQPGAYTAPAQRLAAGEPVSPDIGAPTQSKKSNTLLWVFLIIIVIGIVGFILLVIVGFILALLEPSQVENTGSTLLQFLQE